MNGLLLCYGRDKECALTDSKKERKCKFYFDLFILIEVSNSTLYITLYSSMFKMLCVFISIFILRFVYILETDTTLSYDTTQSYNASERIAHNQHSLATDQRPHRPRTNNGPTRRVSKEMRLLGPSVECPTGCLPLFPKGTINQNHDWGAFGH